MNDHGHPDPPARPATDELWRRFSDELRADLRRRVRDPATAEDLLQEVFLRVHRRLDTLEDPTRSWLRRITRNVLIDHLRRARPSDPLPEALRAPDGDDGEPDPVEQRLGQWLAARIEALPEHERAAVRAVDLDGDAQSVLARREGISPSGMRSRVQRGRARLRQDLEDCCALELGPTGRVLSATPRADPCQDDCC